MLKKLFILFASVAVLASCSDKIYEELNTDSTKADHINAASQLTYAQLSLYGTMGYVDVHRLYTYAFTQQLMGCWNTTYYGGQNRKDDTEELRPWNNLYGGAIRNLTDGIEHTKNDPSKVNVHAALRIMRVYVGSLLTDYYGDVPYFEAGMGFLGGNTHPKYDTQKDIYHSFFTELDSCAAMFDVTKESISSDAMFGGDINLWKQFANSLCLRYAMRLSKVEPDFAKEQFVAAWKKAQLSNDAVVKHMNVAYSFADEASSDYRGNALSKYFYGNDPANNPTYICSTFWDQLYNTNDPRLTMLFRFYVDNYMSLTSADGRYDITDAMLATAAAEAAKGENGKSVIWPNYPFNFAWDVWASYPDIDGSELKAAISNIQVAHPDYDCNPPYFMHPKLSNNYLRSDNPGVVMTQAEVKFLGAEAAVRGWISDDAAALYEQGVRAAINFEVEHYNATAPEESAVSAYLAGENIVFSGSDEDKIRLINIQAWIHNFHNPAECWANLRRSNYPVLLTYDELVAAGLPIKNEPVNGNAIPVRFEYPQKEASYNGDNYNEAKARVEGGYNWNAPLWWDK